MNRPQLPGTDTRPWYRQFWPWFLIALPATVVVASLVMVYIASEGADDLVADDYYKEGLAINRRLEAVRQAQALDIHAELAFGDDSVRVAVNASGDPQRLALHLSHPLEADLDFVVSLSRIAPGQYAGHLRTAVGPRWHWSLRPAGERWRLEGVVGDGDRRDER